MKKISELFDEADNIGVLSYMDYTSAVVVSNDYHVNNANGIPLNCFLIAVSGEQDNNGIFIPDEERAILLSVKGLANLETGRDHNSLKEELARKRVKDVDHITLEKLQLLGFSCKIVGTFYQKDNTVSFGSDLDRVLSYNNYTVLKPKGSSLGKITSYTRNNNNPLLFNIGKVRYSETETKPDEGAKVFVDINDFVGKKTAVFGMTRTGKSNTIKIVTEQIFNYAKENNKKVGQLIFDPQGEYANVNKQDKGALANLGTGKDVVILRTNPKNDGNAYEERLLINFFEEENTNLLWTLMLEELNSGVSQRANYTSGLETIEFDKPEPRSENYNQNMIRYNRKRLGLYALMDRAKIKGDVKNLYIKIGEENTEKVISANSDLIIPATSKDTIWVKNTEDAKKLFDWILQNKENLSSSWQKSINDGEMSDFRNQVEQYEENGRRGVTSAFMRIKKLFDKDGIGDIRQRAWEHLVNGRILIIDLSFGTSSITKLLSEMIVQRILDNASEKFTSGHEMSNIQLVVEEAHNLFDRNKSMENEMDPWVRLSKEAAKYNIGLMYATQEVSSVDPRILSNTSNWIVAHLNSRGETNALSSYYSFKDWSDHLIACESKGFVRLKTESSPFIIPVQIDIFSPKSEV